MNIAVLGTGTVGETIGSKLIELGHTIKMGSRTNTNEKELAWVQKMEVKPVLVLLQKPLLLQRLFSIVPKELKLLVF